LVTESQKNLRISLAGVLGSCTSFRSVSIFCGC
jgi:hypothetical protein